MMINIDVRCAISVGNGDQFSQIKVFSDSFWALKQCLEFGRDWFRRCTHPIEISMDYCMENSALLDFCYWSSQLH